MSDLLKYKRRFEDEQWEVLEPIPKPRYEKSDRTMQDLGREGVEYMANRFKERYMSLMDFHKDPNWEKFQDVYLPEVGAVQDAYLVPIANTVSKAARIFSKSKQMSRLNKSNLDSVISDVRHMEDAGSRDLLGVPDELRERRFLNDFADKYTKMQNSIATRAGDIRRAVERRGPHRATWELIESHDKASDALFISPKKGYVGSMEKDGSHTEAIERLIFNKKSKLRKAVRGNKELNKIYDNISGYQIATDDKFGGIRIASPFDFSTGTITSKKLSMMKKYLKEMEASKLAAVNDQTIYLDSIVDGEVWTFNVPYKYFKKLKGVNTLKKKYGELIVPKPKPKK